VARVSSSVRSRAASGSRARPKVFGCETPRIWTPPLRELTPETTLGFSVIEFADTMLGMQLLPWQQWLLIHMLELREDDTLRFRTVLILVARQNGKSTLSQVLALWFMYVYGIALVIGTAQDLDVAEEIWQGAVDLVTETDDNDTPVRPDLFDLHERVVNVNGKKALELKTGSRWKVKAANRRAGRSLSGDLVLLDELREHQTWDAWGALTKTTMARAMALIVALSNAGDAASIVLRYLRKMAHAALGDPDGINAEDDPAALLEMASPDDLDDLEFDEDDDSLAIFEWSAPPDCPIRDRDGWAQANPSLGYTIAERTIASAAHTDPEWVFRTEVLCQWSEGALEGPFPAGKWETCLDEHSAIASDAPVTACIDVSWNRSSAYVAVAGRREDGLPHVEVVAARAGTDWVVDWFTDEKKPHRASWPVVVQVSSPAGSLIEDLEAAGLEVVEWKGADLGAGCGAFYDQVTSEKLRHLAQPILDVPASVAATRPINDAWVWDRKRSPVDIAPLVAVTGATWAMLRPPETPPPPAQEPTVDLDASGSYTYDLTSAGF
jgi:phage terminase large subunit-like protein